MKRMPADIIDFYNTEVVQMICDKYGFTPLDALRDFVFSQTHAMLENANYGMGEFGAPALFEIWECEKITGDPRNSVYIRED